MRGRDRGFNPVEVKICSVQDGASRYSRSEGSRRYGPPVARYRNNLTALSQRHNLLFVACQSVIYTFVPQFPNQTLSQKARIAVDLPRTSTIRPGFIDPTNPHAVNHMIVGDIGQEEILLVSCDDGDVIAFTTGSFERAIQENHSEFPDIGLRISAFFVENVGQSAWGLAIHKAARLIAVSANTHEVTVFAFALGRASSPESNPEEEDGIFASSVDELNGIDHWNSLTGPYRPEERATRNIKVTLTDHDTNIPSISFCNSEADPYGQYLASTDIDGRTFVWDVWQQKIIDDLSAGGSTGGRSSSTRYGGWAVICLDPRTFRTTHDRVSTFGGDVDFPKHGMQSSTWDISSCLQSIPDNSLFHPSLDGASPGSHQYSSNIQANRQGHASVRDRLQNTFWAGINEMEDIESDEESEEDYSNDRVLEEAFYLEDDLNDDTMELDESDTERSPELDEAVLETILAGNIRRQRRHDSNIFNDDRQSQPESLRDQTPQDRLNASEERTAVSSRANSNSLHSQIAPESAPNGDLLDLPFHLFCTSKSDIALLNRKGRFTTSRVVCTNLARQIMPPGFLHPLSNFDRLNLFQQIPELGVIIVASQIGRAAVITTTKTKALGARSTVGFRVDHILPFKSQENIGVRPQMPLLGIATGPVQGRESVQESAGDVSPARSEEHASIITGRRYRLLMVYYDHTVLSYEIGRSTRGSGYEIDDRTLIL